LCEAIAGRSKGRGLLSRLTQRGWGEGSRGGRGLVLRAAGTPSAEGACPGACPPRGVAWPRPSHSPTAAGRGRAERLSQVLRSQTLTGASGRRQLACSAEQKVEPPGEKGTGEGRRDSQSKVSFAPTPAASWGCFLATSDRAGQLLGQKELEPSISLALPCTSCVTLGLSPHPAPDRSGSSRRKLIQVNSKVLLHVLTKTPEGEGWQGRGASCGFSSCKMG
jgi:hypothetical protein